jgi:RNA polymerase sigma-70 factor, ECF subfamily
MRPPPVPPELRGWIASVVEDNSGDLLRYFQRRAPHEDAADLLGQLLLVLWQNGARVPSSAIDARMWCFGIARNVLHEYRRRRVKAVALADELRGHLRDTSNIDHGADTAMESAMRAEVVRRALRMLDERSRELVILVHWDGFRIAEAARLLSLNESTARTRHERALRRLGQLLKRHRQEEEEEVETRVRMNRAPQDLSTDTPR